MKFYEAMCEIKGTQKMFTVISGGCYASVYRFTKDGNGLVRSDLWYALVDRYWLPVYFNCGEWFNNSVVKADCIILNDLEDLYRLYKSRGGEMSHVEERLKLARKYGVINKAEHQRLWEVLNDNK